MSHILILGAKSDIAKAIASVYINNGYNLYLAARGSSELNEFSTNLCKDSKNTVKIIELDILKYESHKKIYEDLDEKPEGVICSVGYLGEQKRSEMEFDHSTQIFDTNFTGIVSFLNIVANDFEKRGFGFIVGISSVAGDRGKKSNYMYGSAKAALSIYLSGIRNRLYKKKIHVLTVKPGFVYTKMTNHLKLSKFLTSTPQEIANEIYKAQQNKKEIIYVKSIWYWIMILIKIIPERFFKKSNL